MGKILLLQTRLDRKLAKREKFLFEKIIGKKIVVVNISREKLKVSALNETAKIIIGGSGDFSFSKSKQQVDLKKKILSTSALVKKAIISNMPILGICLGHQYLGYLLGSKVVNDKKQEEIGTFKVKLTKAGESDTLFNGIPREFFVQQGHMDSLQSLPRGTVLLGSSTNCKIASFKIKGKNIYGVQFHPELNKSENGRRAKRAGYNDVVCIDSPFAHLVVKNFIKLK